METGLVSNNRQSSLARHRRRMKAEGFVRVEVRVPEEDAALVRRIARARRPGESGLGADVLNPLTPPWPGQAPTGGAAGNP